MMTERSSANSQSESSRGSRPALLPLSNDEVVEPPQHVEEVEAFFRDDEYMRRPQPSSGWDLILLR